MSVQHSETGNYFKPAEGNKDFLPRESPLDSTEHYSLITAHRGKTLETDRAPPPHSGIRSDTECCCSLVFLNEIFYPFYFTS